MAIARINNTSSLPANVTTSTRTDNINCGSGADFLAASVNIQDAGATYSGATYNGVSMTQNSAGPSAEVGGAGRTLRGNIYYLVAPSTGTNALVVTCSEAVSNGFRTRYASYSGVHQTTPEDDADIANSNSATTISVTLTSSDAGCWAFACAENESTSFDNSTNYVGFYNSSIETGDSNTTVGTGSIVVEMPITGGIAADNILMNAILIKPAGGAVASTPLRMMMGIGT